MHFFLFEIISISHETHFCLILFMQTLNSLAVISQFLTLARNSKNILVSKLYLAEIALTCSKGHLFTQFGIELETNPEKKAGFYYLKFAQKL